MKVNTFIAVATCLLVATYVGVMRIQPYKPSDITKCIPSTTLVYFEQKNPVDSLDSVVFSSLERKILAIDFAAVAKEIGVAEETIAWMHHLAKAAKSIQNDSLIRKLCGNRFALAILPPSDKMQSSQDSAEFLKENLVIIAEPQKLIKVLGSITSMLTDSVGGVKGTSVQYGHHRILRIVRNGQSYALAALDDLVIIGQSERQLRRCIDTFDGEISSFSDNTELLAFKSSFPAFDNFLVLPFKNIGEYFSALLDGYYLGDMAFISRKASSLVGITGFFYGAKKQKSIFKEKMIVRYESQSIKGMFRDRLATRPIKPSRFFLISPKPMFYLWSNSFDSQGFLNYAQGWGKEGGGDADIVARLKSSVIGKDFKDLPMFGKEITVIAEQSPVNTPLPLPLAMIFVPVVDKDTLKATMLELVDTYDIPVSTEEYDSVEYTFWSQSPQEGLFPLYGFWGEYFFLGNSVTLLQKIIDAKGRGLSLLDIDSVKKDDPGVTEKNNLMVYSNNIQVINILEIFLRAFGTIAAIEDRGFAKKARVVIQKIILPLLEEVKIFDTSVTRSYFTPEMIVVDTYTNISHHP
ncbi:MAG: hypothetical protein V2B20_03825 [Pseudomonadota bacterium]